MADEYDRNIERRCTVWLYWMKARTYNSNRTTWRRNTVGEGKFDRRIGKWQHPTKFYLHLLNFVQSDYLKWKGSLVRWRVVLLNANKKRCLPTMRRKYLHSVFGVRRQDFCFVNIYASSWSFGDGFFCLFSLQTVGFEYIIYYVGFLWSNNVTEEGAAVFTDRITTFRGHILWRILYFDLFSLEMARIQATFQKWTWYKIYATSRRGSE